MDEVFKLCEILLHWLVTNVNNGTIQLRRTDDVHQIGLALRSIVGSVVGILFTLKLGREILLLYGVNIQARSSNG